jgi:N-acetyl-anhydromuramyl-L-alanine amidase AmpD
VRIFDAALLSTAIGLTCSSVFLFASDYPASFVPTAPPPPVETTAPRSKDFVAVVIHAAATCKPRDPGSQDSRAHFIVPQEDQSGIVRIEATPRWREQLAADHTRNKTVNRRSIGVWVELASPDAVPSPAQSSALASLVGKLRTNYGIPPERVFTHAEVDVETKCGTVLRR